MDGTVSFCVVITREHSCMCFFASAQILRLLFMSVRKLLQSAESAFEFQIIPVKPF